MNRFIFTLIGIIFLNNCSLNENSKIWKNKKNNLETNKNITKVFQKNTKSVEVFNENLKLDISEIKVNNKIIDNQNYFGSQTYTGGLNKVGIFKFSKFEEINKLDFKPSFLKDGIIFFDKKGSIIS